MGITKECFKHYEVVIKNNLINFDDCFVVELGSQTVHFDDKEFLQTWARRSSVSESFISYMHADITGYEMHRLMGHRYHCIDFDDLKGRIKPYKIDLNTGKCPSDLVGTVDMVTNFGTTEHVINQQNSFQIIHDMTRVWGVMIHVVPIARYNHGFFNYNPGFFTSLARYNNYKIFGLYTSKDLHHNVLQDLIPYTGDYYSNHEYIHVIYQKTNKNEFTDPQQIYTNGRFI